MSAAMMRTLVFLASVGFSSSQTPDCSYIGLLNHLNLSATKNVLAIMRPVKNWTTATLVQTDMLFYGILEVDEKSQTIKSQIAIRMRWKNEFLTWNSSDFCGIDALTIPRSLLWIPDINIEENLSDTVSVENSPPLSLYPSGLTMVNARQLLTSTCQLNLLLFPFDEQSCNMTFSSMNSDVNTMKLGTFYNDTDISKMSEVSMITEGEWQLVNIKVVQYMERLGLGIQSKLVFMVHISRRPMLYVIILIIPLFYLLVLDLASFFIHEARGEKLSFKVTVLLSISVFLLILQDMLPSTEAKLPVIAQYCMTNFTLVGISVLEAMLVSYLIDFDGRAGKEAQSSVDANVEIQMEGNPQREPCRVGENVGVKQENLPMDLTSDGNLLKLILEEVRAARQGAGRQEKVKTEPGYYRRLAVIIDSVFFVLYFVVFVIYLVYTYIAWFPQH